VSWHTRNADLESLLARQALPGIRIPMTLRHAFFVRVGLTTLLGKAPLPLGLPGILVVVSNVHDLSGSRHNGAHAASRIDTPFMPDEKYTDGSVSAAEAKMSEKPSIETSRRPSLQGRRERVGT
jgi:hypothetical protein